MKTKTPSDVVASLSERATVSWRKKPFCEAPADVRASVFCVITPRTKYVEADVPFPLGGASGERKVGPSTRSETEPCTSDTRRGSCTVTVVVQLSVCGVVSLFTASTSTAYEPAGTFAPTLERPARRAADGALPA